MRPSHLFMRGGVLRGSRSVVDPSVAADADERGDDEVAAGLQVD